MADFLIAHIFELEIQDNDGRTPFDYALRYLLAQKRNEPWSIHVKEAPAANPVIFTICIKLLNCRP